MSPLLESRRGTASVTRKGHGGCTRRGHQDRSPWTDRQPPGRGGEDRQPPRGGGQEGPAGLGAALQGHVAGAGPSARAGVDRPTRGLDRSSAPEGAWPRGQNDEAGRPAPGQSGSYHAAPRAEPPPSPGLSLPVLCMAGFVPPLRGLLVPRIVSAVSVGPPTLVGAWPSAFLSFSPPPASRLTPRPGPGLLGTSGLRAGTRVRGAVCSPAQPPPAGRRTSNLMLNLPNLNLIACLQ